MRELAYIAKIEALTPIPEKDRIELATIAGWEVIVEKGKHKEGDLVVYVEYDTVLPAKPEFEFLRKRCYSNLYDGFRIRNMKMAGVFSQGIVFPTDILPNGTAIKEGKVVADIIGVVKYDPEAKKELSRIGQKRNPVLKLLMRNKLFRKVWMKFHTKPKGGYPKTVAKSDETNIQKLFEEYKEAYPQMSFYLTEKLEGQAGTYLLQKNKYRFFSHNIEVTKAGNTNWKTISDTHGMEVLLRRYKRKHGIELAIQGEIVGPGIQKNIYGFKNLRFYVYKITDVKTGKPFQFNEMLSMCEELNLERVPYLGIESLERFDDLKDVIEHSNGQSVLNKKVKREGIVWRSVVDQSIGFKAKSPEYMIWFDKKDKTE